MTAPVIIITGPTASGKTYLSELLAQHMGGEIINADMGQFYTPLTVGTAKPDWQKAPFKSHLFDIIDTPCELNVAEYRRLVAAAVTEIRQKNHIPIIVGGSFFYIKSLFFPLYDVDVEIDKKDTSTQIDFTADTQSLWMLLNSIDQKRASVIHQNDRYRIERALKIWQQTGKKPSSFQPVYDPLCSALIISLDPTREVLNERICQRAEQMIKIDGWVAEAEQLMHTQWEQFVRQKGLIGYVQLFNWIQSGKLEKQLNKVIESIMILTRQYARRQSIFWKKLKCDLELHQTGTCPIEIITLPGFQEETLNNLIFSINQLFKKQENMAK